MKNNNNKKDEYQGKLNDSENEMIFLHVNSPCHGVATPFQSCVDDRHIPFRATDGKFYAVDFFRSGKFKDKELSFVLQKKLSQGICDPQ